MCAVDTNLVVRLFAQDDAGKAAAARQAMVVDSVFVPKTVVGRCDGHCPGGPLVQDRNGLRGRRPPRLEQPRRVVSDFRRVAASAGVGAWRKTIHHRSLATSRPGAPYECSSNNRSHRFAEIVMAA